MEKLVVKFKYVELGQADTSHNIMFLPSHSISAGAPGAFKVGKVGSSMGRLKVLGCREHETLGVVSI